MKCGMLVVCTFNDREKAEAVKNWLTAAGLRADMVHEAWYQKLWFLSHPLAHEKVYVDEGNFHQAREMLEAAEAREGLLHCEVRCLKCGSVDVDYPHFTRKFIMPLIVEFASLLLGFQRQFYCNACHYMWPAKEKVLEPKLDILNWPAPAGRKPPVKTLP